MISQTYLFEVNFVSWNPFPKWYPRHGGYITIGKHFNESQKKIWFKSISFEVRKNYLDLSEDLLLCSRPKYSEFPEKFRNINFSGILVISVNLCTNNDIYALISLLWFSTTLKSHPNWDIRAFEMPCSTEKGWGLVPPSRKSYLFAGILLEFYNMNLQCMFGPWRCPVLNKMN